jgi:hypothetical protein
VLVWTVFRNVIRALDLRIHPFGKVFSGDGSPVQAWSSPAMTAGMCCRSRLGKSSR